MIVKTNRRVIVTSDKKWSEACGCSGADGKPVKAKGNFLDKAQGAFNKGKGFLDKNPGIKDTLGGILSGNKGTGNDSTYVAPTTSYTPPAEKQSMSKNMKIGLIAGGSVLALVVIYFIAKKK